MAHAKLSQHTPAVQSETATQGTTTLPPLTYKGIPVLPTDMLAQAYEVEAKQIRQNFTNNRERFVEGKHFFQLSGNDLKEFKNYVENFDLVQLDKRAPHFTLWTERGAARHAKMLNSDRAWDVFELLEETFFQKVKSQSFSLTPFPPVKILPKSRRDQLNELVLAKLTDIPPAFVWKTRMSIWAAFNTHFGIPRYNLLPEERMPEAISFLSELQPAPDGKVKRRSSQLSLPVGDVRQTISSLSVLIERAQSILAAFPANMGGGNHD